VFATVSIQEVTDFIVDGATSEDLDRIYAAAKIRRTALRAKVAASVRVGTEVTLREISPKYFAGLTGVVTKIDGQRATVRFDARSTDVLRYKGARRFYIPAATAEYQAGGFPLSSCHPKA
jgi:hypothetical protein